MQAVVLDEFGGPEVLRVREVPSPVPGPDEVLVDVASASLNRSDLNQRKGRHQGPRPPVDIPGLDVAGTVRAVGERVRSWSPGDEVMALVDGGGYAQQATVHERRLMRVPAAVGVADAGAIPEVWLTAWDALVVQGGLTSGRTALVHGGGSGVGTAAIQIVKALGARLVATCSAGKVARCTALGADRVVDYRSEDFVAAAVELSGGRGVDVVLDIVGAETMGRNIEALASRGRIVQVSSISGNKKATVALDRLSVKRATLIGTRLKSRPLEEKCTLIQRFAAEMLPRFDAGGPCRPVIDRRYPLSEVAQAHAYLESNASFGKVMLVIPAAS